MSQLFVPITLTAGPDFSKEVNPNDRELLDNAKDYVLVLRADLRKDPIQRRILRPSKNGIVLMVTDPRTDEQTAMAPNGNRLRRDFAIFESPAGTLPDEIAANLDNFILVARADLDKPANEVTCYEFSFEHDQERGETFLTYKGSQTEATCLSIESFLSRGEYSPIVFMRKNPGVQPQIAPELATATAETRDELAEVTD